MTHSNRPLAEAAGAELTCNELSPGPATDTTPSVNACLTAALEYAELGIGVFPLSPRKKPLWLCRRCRIPGGCPGRDRCDCDVDTCHGFYAASIDGETITRWWIRHPDWQLGIRTGAASDLVVLDVDLDNGGLDSLIALQRAGLDIRGSATQLSGSGRSFHLIYAHPGGRVPCSAGKVGPGLDVRGDGGYVVGAPSRHPDTGARYQLLGGLSDLPLWPTSAAPPAPTRPRSWSIPVGPQAGAAADGLLTPARLAALAATVREAPVGQRRLTLFWAACRLGECAGSQRRLMRAAEALQQAGREAGLAEAEASATLLDGVREGRSS